MGTVPVKIYSTQFCPFCIRAKALIEGKGVAFEEIDLTSDDQLRVEMQEKTGWMTVPMIFIGDEFIGGFDELSALDLAGDLDAKLGL